MAGGKNLSHWKFTKKKNGYVVTKNEGNSEYSLGNTKTGIFWSLQLMSHNFQPGDIIDTGGKKEDIIFWHEDYEQFVMLPKGFTNNTIWMPRMVAGECN